MPGTVELRQQGDRYVIVRGHEGLQTYDEYNPFLGGMVFGWSPIIGPHCLKFTLEEGFDFIEKHGRDLADKEG